MIIDKGWKNFKRGMVALDGRSVKVGHIASLSGAHLTMIAVWNHYGTRKNGKQHIPPRQFHKFTWSRAKSKAYGRNGAVTQAFKSYQLACILGVGSASVALRQVGSWYKAQLEQGIQDFTTPANAESTIAKKGFNDPLIEHLNLLKGVKLQISGRIN